jgi:AcrR family transcriptional regulator
MGSRTRRRLNPELRREEIVEAAERLLRKHGPAVRVEDIVREAGAAKGTFYLYFATWDDLLETIHARVVKEFDEAHSVEDSGSLKQDRLVILYRLATAFVDSVIAMGGLHTVLFHTDFARRRPIPEEDDPIRRLTTIVRERTEAGAFADVDADFIGRYLFAVIHETADVVEAGEDRERALNAMRWILRRVLEPEAR